MTKFVTFTTYWEATPVSVNPDSVSDVEDFCGNIKPGSLIRLKNKKTYLVAGVHADIVAALGKEAK